jgi:hypothetical protein
MPAIIHQPEVTAEQAQDEVRRANSRQICLTDAWTPWRAHATQAAYFWSPVRFNMCPAGRRSGKTALAKRKVVLRDILGRRAKMGLPVQVGLFAPTFTRAKRIWFMDLVRMIPNHWIRKVNYSQADMEILTHWNASVRVFGIDNPTQVEGVEWDRIYGDEFADAPENCFQFHIRPALGTVGREGGADLFGVPDEVGRNQAEYETLCERGLRYDPAILGQPHPEGDETGQTGEYCTYHWPSWDIMTEQEIRSVRSTTDEVAFQQEYGGLFVRSGGKAIPRFDPNIHVSDFYADFCPSLPICWSLDFGVNPAVSLLCQEFNNQSWVVDEIVLQDSSTDVMAEAFAERVRAHGWPFYRVELFGDAAGRSPHSNTGLSDYEIILQKFEAWGLLYGFNVLTANPPIKDSINAVRSRMVNMDGVVRLHIHPRCRRLIDDLKRAPWPHDLRPFHALAALRYYCYARYGMGAGGDLVYSTGSTADYLPAFGALAGTPSTRY